MAVPVTIYPLAVVCLDPGQTTGVTVYTIGEIVEQPKLVFAEQVTNWQQVVPLVKRLVAEWQEVNYTVQVVYERFDNRPGVVNPDLTPLYIIEPLKQAFPDAAAQTPSQAKNLVKPAGKGKPDGLKRFGYYLVGKRHANDSSRHFILYAVEKLKNRYLQERGWSKT